ncbi:MAG: hypothetical protein AB4372_29430 [Xenococcus sp. (in: cyanobacteria)]
MENLIEVWKIWFEGSSLDGITLWGISMRWWARIGLLAQYFGALTIIVEVIGPDRLNEFGKNLKTPFSIKQLWKFALDTIKWGYVYFRRVISLPWKKYLTYDQKKQELLDKTLYENPFTSIVLFVSFGMFIITVVIQWGKNFWLISVLSGFFAFLYYVLNITTSISGICHSFKFTWNVY